MNEKTVRHALHFGHAITQRVWDFDIAHDISYHGLLLAPRSTFFHGQHLESSYAGSKVKCRLEQFTSLHCIYQFKLTANVALVQELE